ncbi:heme-binding protein 2-like [Chenopodium quinoa]|uniref:Heme-binding protein 2 n=1 Tax=Chenopodium quinoa TaxID=63459 RepID=A0A803NAP5_CHEQI|nr:heme-binding protein 2-like [Chenopodium quinoa]
MAAIKLLELALLFNLFSTPNQLGGLFTGNGKPASFPPSCNRIECPSFDTIEQGNGYEIRRYNSSVWVSTNKIVDISLVQATRTGFLQLFNYIQGKNEYKKTIEMTAPVITQVSPSDGPLCESSFVVSFYVPKENQADPPPAEGLHIQRWDSTYVAVRQFGGFVSDYEVGEVAAALESSLAGSKWAAAIEKAQTENPKSSYTVAQYNSPFEIFNRVNEIWLSFGMEDVAAE